MTITVSLEELRAFESALFAWHETRAGVMHRALIESTATDFKPMAEHVAACREVGKQWEKSHPMPKLIPSV